MTPHVHPLLDPGLVLSLPLVVAAALAVGGSRAESRRGRPWPLRRLLLLLAGLGVAIVSLTGPFAQWAHADPRGAMLAHLALGLLAPLLITTSAPVTLALRALDVTAARRLSRVLRSRPARVLAHPIPAVLLSTGSLWLVHATGLLAAAHADPLLHALLGVHFLASGCLLTGALIGVDPAPHRAPFGLRVGVVLGSIAAHALLGTTLYAEAASGVERQAAQILYYGGDLLELALVTVLFAQHYAATAPGRARKPLGGRPVHP